MVCAWLYLSNCVSDYVYRFLKETVIQQKTWSASYEMHGKKL